MKHIKTFESYIDTNGELQNLERSDKILYPYATIERFVQWFHKEYEDYSMVQGWIISDADTDIPSEKYESPNDRYWTIERIDDPDSYDGLVIHELESDEQAIEKAKRLGLMVDEYGVLYGYKGKKFI